VGDRIAADTELFDVTSTTQVVDANVKLSDQKLAVAGTATRPHSTAPATDVYRVDHGPGRQGLRLVGGDSTATGRTARLVAHRPRGPVRRRRHRTGGLGEHRSAPGSTPPGHEDRHDAGLTGRVCAPGPPATPESVI